MDLNTISDVIIARDRSVLTNWRTGDAWLGGGTALFAEPNPQLRRLVDLAGFGWPALGWHAGALEIAATCTLAELAEFGADQGLELFGQCCQALLGSFKIQRVATVGGNMCGALPAAPMVSLTAALGAQCLIWTPDGGQRTVAAVDFVRGPQLTCLAPGELLRSITIPAATVRSVTAFRQFSLSELGRSAALIIGRLDGDSGSGAVTFTVTAATPRPVQVSFAALPCAAQLHDAITDAITDYFDDVHGNPLWRRHLTYRLAEEVRRELAA